MRFLRPHLKSDEETGSAFSLAAQAAVVAVKRHFDAEESEPKHPSFPAGVRSSRTTVEKHAAAVNVSFVRFEPALKLITKARMYRSHVCEAAED